MKYINSIRSAIINTTVTQWIMIALWICMLTINYHKDPTCNTYNVSIYEITIDSCGQFANMLKKSK